MLLNGETVGSHDGLWTYTIGERHRMAGRVGHKEKWYVAGKDRTKNALVIVPGRSARSSSIGSARPSC